MDCLYSDEINCDCTKCINCGLCTNGSQLHRSCWKDYLTAGSDEELPTEEQEAEAIALQPNTPLTAEQIDDLQIAEYESDELDTQPESSTWMFQAVRTSIDIVYKALREAYPDEDFNNDLYNNYIVSKYVSDEVSKFEFFIMQNQYGKNIFNKNAPFRMRKGVHLRDGKAFHLNCINADADGYDVGRFSKGIVTVEAQSRFKMVNMMKKYPDFFFCANGECEKFLFFDVGYFSDTAWAWPPKDSYPDCPYVDRIYEWDPNNYVKMNNSKQHPIPLTWTTIKNIIN